MAKLKISTADLNGEDVPTTRRRRAAKPKTEVKNFTEEEHQTKADEGADLAAEADTAEELPDAEEETTGEEEAAEPVKKRKPAAKPRTVKSPDILELDFDLLEDVDTPEERFLKLLVYGPSGHGKTTFLGSAQEDERTGPIVVLDYEAGLESIRGKGIQRIPIKSWDDFTRAYNFLAKGNHPFKTICIDSLSEAHTFALLERLKDPTKNRRIEDLLDEGDYGIAGTQMRRMIRAFRDLPYHFIATAIAKDDTDVREGAIKKPAMTGKLADEVNGIFDIVTYLALTTDEEGDPLRVAVLQNYPKLRTKVRVPEHVECPDDIDDPTVSHILDLLDY